MGNRKVKDFLEILLRLFAAQHHPAVPGDLVDDDHVDPAKGPAHFLRPGIDDAGQDQMAVHGQPAG